MVKQQSFFRSTAAFTIGGDIAFDRISTGTLIEMAPAHELARSAASWRGFGGCAVAER
jgi:hypothetical protein